jgi:hypothetical protein
VTASAAVAADMPIKAPPAPVVVDDWSGFYLGAHGGYGWGQDPFTKNSGAVAISSTAVLVPNDVLTGLDS